MAYGPMAMAHIFLSEGQSHQPICPMNAKLDMDQLSTWTFHFSPTPGTQGTSDPRAAFEDELSHFEALYLATKGAPKCSTWLPAFNQPGLSSLKTKTSRF